MAKTFKTTVARVNTLCSLFNSLTDQEIITLKPQEFRETMRMVNKLGSEMTEQIKDFRDQFKKINEEIVEMIKPLISKVKELRVSEMDASLREKEIQNLIELSKMEEKEYQEKRIKELKLEEESKKEIEVEIGSEDRFKLLKSFFEKIVDGEVKRKNQEGKEMHLLNGREEIVAILDALEEAKNK